MQHALTDEANGSRKLRRMISVLVIVIALIVCMRIAAFYLGGRLLTMPKVWDGYGETRLLITMGANVNSQNSEGYTPLMFAVINQDEAAIRQLMARGADVSSRNFKGDTALDIAQKIGNPKVIQILSASTQ